MAFCGTVRRVVSGQTSAKTILLANDLASTIGSSRLCGSEQFQIRFCACYANTPLYPLVLKRMVVSHCTADVRDIALFCPASLRSVFMTILCHCKTVSESTVARRVRLSRGEAVERCGKQVDWSCACLPSGDGCPSRYLCLTAYE